MPNKRINMRKIRDILRLRFEAGLSFRQISQCADVSTGAIQKMLKRLDAVGVSWPLPEGMSESRLASSPTPAPVGSRILTGLISTWSCVKKASPGTCCGRSTASGCRSGHTATRSSAIATTPGVSYKNAPCASNTLPVKNALSTTAVPPYLLSRRIPVNAVWHRSS